MSIKGFFLKCILWGASKKEAVSTLNNVALEDRGVLGTHFGTIKTFIESLGKMHLEVLLLETFILVLMKSVVKNHGKNSIR